MSRTERGKALIVGGGFTGSHVARAFLESGRPTVLLTRPRLAHPPETEGVTLVEGEASDPALLDQSLDGVGHVVYCAGGLMPADSGRAPIADVTLTLPPLITVLEALKTRPHIELTFLSSGGTVYGVPHRLPVPEDHPTDPICGYGVLKLAAEKYIGLYGRLYGVRSRILRCANVFGENQPADRGQGVVAAWMHRILRREPVTLFGGGAVVRDYLYVGDLARLIVDLSHRQGGPTVMNVGSGRGTSLAELLSLLREIADQPVVVQQLPPRDVDIPRIVLDIGRVRAFAQFHPSPLLFGLERAWAGAARTVSLDPAPTEPGIRGLRGAPLG